jgi:ParB family chromosome partitioning protein
MALIENIQREQLSAIEEARALERLSKEFELTHQQVATAVGKSRTVVTNLLRLLSLNADVKTLMDQGKLELGHAKVLLGLKGAQQSAMARHVVEQGLSVRALEARLMQKEVTPKQPAHVKLDPNVKHLQEELSLKLGAPVHILYNRQGKGKMIIEFYSLDALEGILAHVH